MAHKCQIARGFSPPHWCPAAKHCDVLEASPRIGPDIAPHGRVARGIPQNAGLSGPATVLFQEAPRMAPSSPKMPNQREPVLPARCSQHLPDLDQHWSSFGPNLCRCLPPAPEKCSRNSTSSFVRACFEDFPSCFPAAGSAGSSSASMFFVTPAERRGSFSAFIVHASKGRDRWSCC